MGISIGDPGADPSGAVASLQISTTLQAEVQAAQAASVEALFSSLGLGDGISTVA